MLRLSIFLLALAMFGCGSQKDTFKIKNETNFKKSFMPENDLWKEAGLIGDNGMTEEMFNQIIEEVRIVYEPIVKNLGGNLVIKGDYNDTTVNAYADRDGDSWNVSMFGGLAKRPEVTFDGFAMVIAHEIGHHIGGFPFVSDWAANEGESDYFATIAAARQLWSGDGKVIVEVDDEARKICEKNMNNSDLNLCYRQMNAGYSLANLLGALGGTKVSFKTPDKSVVKKTNNNHPAAQCRLDTYVAGALCTVAWNNNVIPQTEKDMAKQSCISPNKTKASVSSRPLCWFKPTI
jgi:hypothetical protein